MSGSLRAGVTFPSSSPLEGNPSTHWAFRPVCVHPKRESSGTQHTDRTRAGHRRRAFPVLRAESRIHAMRAHSSSRRQSTDSKVDRSRRQEKHHRGKRPRVVISKASERSLARVKNGCRARNARPLQGSRASRAKVSSAEETRTFHEVRCASRSWSTANDCPRNCARAARSRRQAPEAVGSCPAREETPGESSITHHRSTHGDVNRRPTWFDRRKKALVLQEPHDTQGCPFIIEMGIRRSYASHRRLSWMRHSR